MTQNQTEPRTTGGDVLVEVMRRHGIDTAFGVISIHNLPLVEAVARELRFVEVRHEAAAVNAADGYARASGRVGVAITSTGTGAGNAAGSMVEALTAGSRVLHITGQVESGYLDDFRGVIHQVPKQLQMLDAVSKGALTVTDAKTAEEDLERAIAQIVTAPQGPISVEWPSDLQYLARPDQQAPYDVTVDQADPPPAGPVAEAARLLSDARRPLIWLGGGAAGARDEITALLHRLGAGLLTSNSGRATVPEDDDLVIGNFAAAPETAPLLEDADLLLSIGTHFRSNETKSYHLALPTPHIQIDVAAEAIGRVYPADVGIVGDAATTLAALNEKVAAVSTETAWSERVRTVRRQVRDSLTDHIGGYAEICHGLRTYLPRDAVVARDVTIPSSQWGNRLLELYERETNIFPLGGGIGQGLAMGLGAACARPDTPTVVIAGDGGLAVHLGELASLAGSEAWCIVLVFNDGGYGVLRNMQEANGWDRAAVDLHTPAFQAVATGMAMPYRLVRGPGEFVPALRHALAVKGPVLIEVDVAAISPVPGAFVPPVHVPAEEG